MAERRGISVVAERSIVVEQRRVDGFHVEARQAVDRPARNHQLPNSSQHKKERTIKSERNNPPQHNTIIITCFTIYRPLLLRHLLLPRWRCRSPTSATTTTTAAARSVVATATSVTQTSSHATAFDTGTPSAWNSTPLLQPHPLSLIYHRFYYRESGHSPPAFLSQSSSSISSSVSGQYIQNQQKRRSSSKTNIMSRSR